MTTNRYNIDTGFTLLMRVNMVRFLNERFLKETPITQTENGFLQDGRPLTDRQVLGLLFEHCFEATESVREDILQALFGH
jgi:hypothetical protein